MSGIDREHNIIVNRFITSIFDQCGDEKKKKNFSLSVIKERARLCPFKKTIREELVLC